MKAFSLGPMERLKSRAALNDLFLNGKSLSHQGIRLLFTRTDLQDTFPIRTAFVVPSRNIKHAVTRNRIRRQMKEAYRKNKGDLYEAARQHQTGISMAIVYQEKTLPEKGKVQEKIIVLLQRLINTLKSGK